MKICKSILIYIICIILFFQNCEIIYATEKSDVIETFEGEEILEEEEVPEEKSDLEEEKVPEEESDLEEEEVPEEESDLEEEEVPEESDLENENPSEEEESQLWDMNWDDDDPLMGRALESLYNMNNIQTDIIGEEIYVHHERYDGFTINKVIDVSKYQGNIDWKKVKASGIDYAIIRAGYRGYGVAGNLKTDEKFKTNIQGAIDAGVDVGVYFFSQAITEHEAIEEAKYTLELIEGYDVSLPIAIDFEYASNGQGLTGRLYNAGLSKDSATKICNAFCKTIKQHGYSAMVYANKSMLESNLNASQIAGKYDVWLAHYTSGTSYTGDYDFWQFSQSKRIEGISSFVDMSFWYMNPQADISTEYYNIKIEETFVNRIYGATRYETAIGIAEEYAKRSGITKFDNIIITSGLNFADALSGSYLAGKKNAPILLTNGENAEYIKAYIKENVTVGGNVYVLGGESAVPEGLCCGLKEFDVKRLWGESRYETNLAILKEAGIENEDILICSGKNFPDSLSASATQKPILLVADDLTEQQEDFLANSKGKNFYIIGGESAVSKSVESNVKKYGTVQRIGGADRYETSVMIAEKFLWESTAAVVTYSHNFPDGLCGGLLAMAIEGPLILTKLGCEKAAKEYAKENGICQGYVLGGNGFVTDESVCKIFRKLSDLEKEISLEFVILDDQNYGIEYKTYISNPVDKGQYYLMQSDNYTDKIYGEPLAYVNSDYKIDVLVKGFQKAKLKEIAMDKLVLAIKQTDGTYKAINNAQCVLNPEVLANNTAEIFKASSKKGLQGVAYASNGTLPVDARYANTKQTLLNLDIADVVNPKSNYTYFTYKGKNYKFSKCSDLVANVKSMNAGYQQYLYGNNGNTKLAVSLCLLLSYDSSNSFLIDPAARSAGHKYYTLNVREEKGRETLEALFIYLGELFGQEDCYVTNWILGNEINSSKAWNYQGSLSFDNYLNCYTKAFWILYNAVKSEKTGNTVSISLDNGWTAAPDTYAGKKVLDSFAKKINALNPNIEWSISYHPYSYPLTRADFWNDSSNTTNSTSTKYISMKNITVLTNYAASLEKSYKMDVGSIRVLLTEQGYSYSAGADAQARAIARGYYIAEFNDRIDAFIIRAIVDDAEEAKGKLYFGLMNSQQDKRIAFYVYEYMDSDLSKLKNTSASSVVTPPNYNNFNNAKKILCNTNWKSIILGFNAGKLATIK